MMRRAAVVALLALLAAGCATEGTVSGGVGFSGDWYGYDDVWYGGGCCVDVPPGSGARPEHPIVLPPDGMGPPRPEQPIALPPAQPKASARASTTSSSSMRSAAPRASAMPRGGGGRGGRR